MITAIRTFGFPPRRGFVGVVLTALTYFGVLIGATSPAGALLEARRQTA